MATGTILSIIGLCFTLFFSGFALFFSIKNNRRTDTKDIEAEVKEKAEIKISLEMINKNTLDIKNEMSSIKEDVRTHHDSIIKLQENVGSLKHRMEEIEEKVEKYHG